MENYISSTIRSFGKNSNDTFKVLVGCAAGTGLCLLLYKINTITWRQFGTISQRTKLQLQKSHAYAVASLALGSVPVFLGKAIGWQNLRPFYATIFGQRWLLFLCLGATAVLTGFTLVYPRERSIEAKRGLWIGSCLSVGTWMAPLFISMKTTKWRAILLTTGAYTFALALPLSIMTLFSNNFLFLNLSSVLSMLLGVLLMHENILPRLKGNLSQRIVVGFLSKSLLTAVVFSGLVLLTNMNILVNSIEHSSETKPVEERRNYERGPLYTKKIMEIILHGIDPTDEIAVGMIIAIATVYVFLHLVWKAIKLLKHLRKVKYIFGSDSKN